MPLKSLCYLLPTCGRFEMRLVLVLIVAIGSGVSGVQEDATPWQRIVNGLIADNGQFPWQVGITTYKERGIYFCGGSLIDRRWVLTAGHCVNGDEVRLGSVLISGPDGVQINSSESFLHPGFQANLNNDVGLVKLSSDAEFNELTQPIRLAKRGDRLKSGENVTAVGWGRTDQDKPDLSRMLKYIHLKTVSNEECAERYEPGEVIESTVCAIANPTRGVCMGDSGGPLIRYDQDDVATHVGVVSFVHDDGCVSMKPFGFQRTESFLDWIRNVTGLDV